jgi:hypothetical protein
MEKSANDPNCQPQENAENAKETVETVEVPRERPTSLKRGVNEDRKSGVLVMAGQN